MKARYLLEDYPLRMEQLRHTAEAVQLLISHLYDVSISIQESFRERDVDRILNMVGEYEEMRQRCLNDMLDVTDAFNIAKQAIGSMEPSHGSILTARYLKGLSLEEIADMRGTSRSTAYRQLDIALAALDEILLSHGTAGT